LSPEVFQTAVRKTIGPPVALFGSLRHIGETKKKFRMKFPKKTKKYWGASFHLGYGSSALDML
jgi:hypothetical protein